MQLNDEEKAMLAGDFGPAVKWAMEHQLQVGRMFDAEDMVSVSQEIGRASCRERV